MTSRPTGVTDVQQRYLDSLDALAVVVDEAGLICAVNAAWRAAATEGGVNDATHGLGNQYVQWDVDHDDDARDAAAGIADVVAGRLGEFSMIYPCGSPTTDRWFEFVVVPLSFVPPRLVLALHVAVDGRFGSAPLHQTTGEAGHRLADVVVVCAWCQRRQLSPAGAWEPLGDTAAYHWQSHGICRDCLARFGTPS